MEEFQKEFYYLTPWYWKNFACKAGEAKVPFFSLSGADFVEMFVGVELLEFVIYLNKVAINIDEITQLEGIEERA